MAVLSDLSIKVAHGTQVHDMWPFGPLVYLDLELTLNVAILIWLPLGELRCLLTTLVISWFGVQYIFDFFLTF